MKRTLAALTLLGLILSATPARPDTFTCAVDDPAGFHNVLPPGQNGNATLGGFLASGEPIQPHADDQLGMYANLVYEYDSLLDATTLTDYYKVASFCPGAIERIEHPKDGLTIVRDSFGVPHIFGDTTYDVVWGTGYVTGEDRLFLTDVLRYVGRGRLSQFLGASESNLAMDRSIYAVAGYTEDELQQQVDAMARFGEPGAMAIQSFYAYADGMNAFIRAALLDPTKLPVEYPALQVLPVPWRVTDIVAVATLIQAVFAAGGGGEVANATLRQALADRLPPARAEALARDLLVREDPEAPVTSTLSFPYLAQPAAPDPDANAIPDAGSLDFPDPVTTIRDGLREIGIPVPDGMSNWLAVTKEHAAGGKPIAVMGPQTGYFSPQLLMEIDIHGGGLDARGATFPGVSLAVLLGRGKDFAWSATSGGSDLVDIRIERLCEPDGSPPTAKSRHYLFNGACIPMYERTDRWVAKPTAGGMAEPELVTAHVERTVHGPVLGRATVAGDPVAVAYQRATFFGEADSTPAFVLLNTNQVHDPQSFFDAMNHVTGSFNWLYVDPDDVGFFHSGLYPVRAPGVDPELPVWGTGEWEWQGFLPQSEHPREINPARGWISSWNNKPARDWQASDANYGYGPIHRVQSLDDRLAARVPAGNVTPVDMVKIMEDAATVDLRGSQMLPKALEVLGARTDVAAYTTILAGWVAGGAHRRDADRSGAYDDEAAVALLDTWYERMIHATFDDELGGLYGLVPMGFDDANRVNHIGSSFQAGYFGYLLKAFRQALGESPASPLDELRCGNGTQAGCADVLAASLLDAAGALTAQYGADPAAWRAPKSGDEIRHSAVGVISVPAIDWQNRPTFQQVVQVERRRT